MGIGECLVSFGVSGTAMRLGMRKDFRGMAGGMGIVGLSVPPPDRAVKRDRAVSGH